MNVFCLYCDTPIQGNHHWSSLFLIEKKQWLCKECDNQFERITARTCSYCSRELMEEICKDCIKWKKEYGIIFLGNQSIFKYNEYMKQYMSQFKFAGDYILGQFFAEELKQFVGSARDQLFVPIPLSEQGLHERGFNQAEMIIREANLPVTSCLHRLDNEKQSKKNRTERLKMKQNFQVTEKLTGKKIVLIDDIYTTGATIHQAARCLKEAGAKTIQSITIARS